MALHISIVFGWVTEKTKDYEIKYGRHFPNQSALNF